MARHLSIVGGYDVAPDVLGAAEEVGARAAEAGLVVVTGGRGGVAEAASRGATRAGGVALGILPGSDRSEANRWCTHVVVTGLGLTRNALVAMNGDAVVALDGSYGTLSEIAFALLAGTPVIGLGTWQLQRHGRADDGIIPSASPADAVERVLALLPSDG